MTPELIKKHLPGFIGGLTISVVAGLVTYFVTSSLKDEYPNAIAMIEIASKYRSKLDAGQINAVEILADLEKPIAGFKLDEVYFHGGNYKTIKITNSSFMCADFSLSNLDRSLIIESNYEFADLSNSSAIRADVSNSDFDFAVMRNANFDQIKITDSSMNAVQAEGASFVGSIIKNVKFTGASLKNANFTDATLENVSFVVSDLTGAVFNNTLFRNVTITGARLNIVEQFTEEQKKNACYHKGNKISVMVYYERENLDGGTELETLVTGTVWFPDQSSMYKKYMQPCEENNYLNLDTIRSQIPLGYKRSKYRNIACAIFPHLHYCN